METLIEQISFWGAIIGSLLLALHITVSGWAYILFMLSNIATIYLLKKSDAPKIIGWQCWFFIVINLIGIGRWLL
jgi:hypothetical protein